MKNPFSPPSAEWFYISEGTEIPQCLAVTADGRKYPGKPQHYTVAPKDDMAFPLFLQHLKGRTSDRRIPKRCVFPRARFTWARRKPTDGNGSNRPNAHLGPSDTNFGEADGSRLQQYQLVHERLDVHRPLGTNIKQPTCTDWAKSRARRERLHFSSAGLLLVEVTWMTTARKEAINRHCRAAPAMDFDDFTRKRPQPLGRRSRVGPRGRVSPPRHDNCTAGSLRLPLHDQVG